MNNKILSRICIILALVIFCTEMIISSAEKDYQWVWAQKAGGTANDVAYAIAVDKMGNSYITGYFQGTAYFGDIQLIAQGSSVVFIAKLDSEGNFLWAKDTGGPGVRYGIDIAVDAMGNSYITGSFYGTVYFGDIELQSQGTDDSFIAKLDPEGNFLWARKAWGILDNRSLGIAVDSLGNSFITGWFGGTIYFGDIQLTTAGSWDVFISKLDPEGNFLWAIKAGGTGNDQGFDIEVDTAGNSYITGYFRGTAYFGDIQLISAGSDDVFSAKIDPEGNFIWAIKAGGTGSDQGHDIAVDTLDNSYIIGFFTGTVYFGDIQLISAGSDDIFAAKIDPEGNFLWAIRAGGTGQDRGRAIALDTMGNSYIAGFFTGTSYFGDIQLISAGSDDVFSAKIDPEGNFLWAIRAGGTGQDYGRAIAVDTRGNAYITGSFQGTAFFRDTQLLSAGNYDVFIAKLGYPHTAVISIKSSLVAGIYTWDYIEGKANSLEEKSSRWTRISNKLDAKKIMTGDITGDGKNEIIVHFADDGLYYYSFEDNIWTNIAGAEDNVIDFTIAHTGYCDHKEIVASVSDSLSLYRDNSWVPILLNMVESVAALNLDRDNSGTDKLVFASSQYGGLFVYDFDTGIYSKICTVSPSQMTAGDVTGDGYPELAAVFDGYGTYLIRYLPDKSEPDKAYIKRYELFDLAGDIRQNSQWVSKSKNGKGLQFNRLTWGTPDEGHLIAMGNIAGGTGSELFLVYQGRTYYYSYDTGSWATFLYAPLKRIISGSFTARAKDDLIICDSSTGNIWLGKTHSSSWELLVASNDTDAMGVLK